MGRDQFNALIKYFEGNPKEAGVVVWDFSRWARSYDDAQYFLALLRRRGYQVHSLENYVPAGNVGKIVTAIHMYGAEEYKDQLSINVKRGLRALIRNYHGWPNASPPRGYKFEPVQIAEYLDGEPHMCNRLIPHSGEAPLICRAFDLAASGLSLNEIRKETGLYHEVSGVAGMLRNKIYIGIYQHSGITVDDFCEPIIDREIFEKVQIARKAALKRSGPYHPRSVGSTYLLSGLVFCGLCGHPLHGQNSKRWRYYLCYRVASRTAEPCLAGRINAETLEADVLRRVNQVLETPDVILQVFEEYQVMGTQQTDGGELVRYKRGELSDLDTQIKRITDGIAKRPDSAALMDKLDELEHQQAEARETLATLEAQQRMILQFKDLNRIRLELRTAMLSAQNEREQQLLVRALKPRITVQRGEGHDVKVYGGDVTFDFGLSIVLPLP